MPLASESLGLSGDVGRVEGGSLDIGASDRVAESVTAEVG